MAVQPIKWDTWIHWAAQEQADAEAWARDLNRVTGPEAVAFGLGVEQGMRKALSLLRAHNHVEIAGL